MVPLELNSIRRHDHRAKLGYPKTINFQLARCLFSATSSGPTAIQIRFAIPLLHPTSMCPNCADWLLFICRTSYFPSGTSFADVLTIIPLLNGPAPLRRYP